MMNGHHIMAIDSSDAVGGDDIGMHMREVRTGETTAVGNYNETNIIKFCEWLCKLLVDYSNLTLIIERRSTGSSIIDYLLLMLPAKGIDPFKRIYNKVVQEADENKERFKEISKVSYIRSDELYTKYKKTFGFATSATGTTSRTELYSSTLLNAAKITGSKVKDKKTIDQILGLEIRNGRVDHPEGEHDDLCICWLLTYWLLFKGKNLSYYGIPVRDILIDNIDHKQENDPRKLYEKREQDNIRLGIDQLIEQLKIEKDDFVAINLENRLKLLISRLSESDRDILGIEELLSKIKDNRRLSRNRLTYYR
jgi:hypothetical protein